MAKLPKRLEEIRNPIILQLYDEEVSAQDLAIIFDLTTSGVYNIIKQERERNGNDK